VVPVPTKATIDGDKLADVPPEEPLQNASFAEFKTKLAEAGVRVFDPAPLLMQRKLASGGAAQYLATDTHWTPDAMEAVARELASFAALSANDGGGTLQPIERQIIGRGDLLRMLKLPEEEQLERRRYQAVKIREVTDNDRAWQPTRDADVLLLGDSFTNIFSLQPLGWGESAGFAEHLSLAAGGRPLDTIVRNSDAAFATREMLGNELARGRDRLTGKRLVIWQFAARELAIGNWKLTDLQVGSRPAQFFTPRPGQVVEVTGVVQAVASVPRPGTVPYADHVVALHLADFATPGARLGERQQAIVFLESMRNYQLLPAARLRPGDTVTLRLKPWSDAAAQHEATNRSELDDPELQLEEPVWGELAN
ncbi:MAG TPA: hypothetical protein VF551_06980, partial [Chthoniobacterales bacterium]